MDRPIVVVVRDNVCRAVYATDDRPLIVVDLDASYESVNGDDVSYSWLFERDKASGNRELLCIYQSFKRMPDALRAIVDDTLAHGTTENPDLITDGLLEIYDAP